MKESELIAKIKKLVPQVYKSTQKAEVAAVEFDELTKFPELKSIIVDLLTSDFDSFLASIDWVAPRPTTFRINLKNDQEFYLIFSNHNWIAQVEGKKYFLSNLPEEEHAVEAISRILRYGPQNPAGDSEGGSESDYEGGDTEPEEVEPPTED